ncbi:MAG: peptidylprolyl isomerase [Opitutae bacterium]|nr:peptidylprolyl isomerase [Opitutae bacterium]
MAQNFVSLHYTLRDPEGRVLDMSQADAPIRYLEGAGQIIGGLEAQLQGLATGTKQRVVVPAAQAYGERDPERMHRVPRSHLPVEGELKVGDQFRTEADPYAPIVTIAALEGEEVLLDANHPLAGVDLTFDVEIVAVQPATPEELAAAAKRHHHGEDGECCGRCTCSEEGGEKCGEKS